jgi:hypothetical protein
MKTQQVKALADRLGKHPATVWRWVARGCDIDSTDSVQQFSSGKKRRRNPHPNTIRKPKAQVPTPGPAPSPDSTPDLNQMDLGPVGPRGAAAALKRLEAVEERSHARLIQAIEAGNPFQIKAAQEFYLRSSETLRRLDLAVESERRNSLERIPMRQIEDISLQIATWLRIAFAQFLSSETRSLMGINDLGEFKAHCIDRFKGLLHATVKGSLKTNPIPPWAQAQVIEAWNVPTL